MTDQTPTQKAQSLGWTQCDYPHKAAKDMWYHPDASICDEGRYVSEEEMLEFIEAENNMEETKKLMPTTKVYTVWCFDPHYYGGESTLIRVFKSKENAEEFTAQKNKDEKDSYSTTWRKRNFMIDRYP